MDIEKVIEELEQVLKILDEQGVSLAAIKLDEALHILREGQLDVAKRAVENNDS